MRNLSTIFYHLDTEIEGRTATVELRYNDDAEIHPLSFDVTWRDRDETGTYSETADQCNGQAIDLTIDEARYLVKFLLFAIEDYERVSEC